jgi:hypothetical protein
MEKMPINAKKTHDAEIQNKGQGRLAEEMALHRVVESLQQECDRICDLFSFVSAEVKS